MSFVILSRPSGNTDKVLRRSEYNREMTGLETLVETYTIRTDARISIQPEKETLHTAYSTADTKFQRMAVESTSFREIDGGLTEMTVTYVGLTSSSGLPGAIVRVIPSTGSGIFGPPVLIEARFVSDYNEIQMLSGQLSSLSSAPQSGTVGIYSMPSFINGTAMPSNPKSPYEEGGTGQTSAYYYRYEGYVMQGIQSERRGLFNLAAVTFNEYAVTLAGSTGGFSKGVFASS